MRRRPIMPNRPKKPRQPAVGRGYRPGLLEALESIADEIDAAEASPPGVRGKSLFAMRRAAKP